MIIDDLINTIRGVNTATKFVSLCCQIPKAVHCEELRDEIILKGATFWRNETRDHGVPWPPNHILGPLESIVVGICREGFYVISSGVEDYQLGQILNLIDPGRHYPCHELDEGGYLSDAGKMTASDVLFNAIERRKDYLDDDVDKEPDEIGEDHKEILRWESIEKEIVDLSSLLYVEGKSFPEYPEAKKCAVWLAKLTCETAIVARFNGSWLVGLSKNRHELFKKVDLSSDSWNEEEEPTFYEPTYEETRWKEIAAEVGGFAVNLARSKEEGWFYPDDDDDD